MLGYIEIDTNLDTGARTSRLSGWADVGNLCVDEAHRRQGVGTWLVAQAAGWLRLGGVTRLLDYADSEQGGYAAFLKGGRVHRPDPNDPRVDHAIATRSRGAPQRAIGNTTEA